VEVEEEEDWRLVTTEHHGAWAVICGNERLLLGQTGYGETMVGDPAAAAAGDAEEDLKREGVIMRHGWRCVLTLTKIPKCDCAGNCIHIMFE